VNTDDQLDQALSRLSREMKPQRDLWPELAQQLRVRQPERRPLALRWVAIAASLLAGVLLWQTLLLPRFALFDEFAGDSWAIAYSAAQTQADEYELEKARRLAQLEYVSEDFGNWQLQLAVWDQAIGQVQMAIFDEPNNPLLRRQMASLYQQQLNYIQLLASNYDY
jgi:hypothetical protein